MIARILTAFGVTFAFAGGSELVLAGSTDPGLIGFVKFASGGAAVALVLYLNAPPPGLTDVD